MTNVMRYLLVPHLALSGLLAIGAAAAWAYFAMTSWSVSETELRRAQSQHTTAKSQLKELRYRAEIAGQMNISLARLAELDKRFGQTVTQSSLVADTTVLVQRADVDLLNSENTSQTAGDTATVVRQNLSLEGTYSALRYLIFSIENASYLHVVEETDWTALDSGNHKLRLQIATYFAKDGS